MKTINISITVPDGVEVKVSGATESKPFVEREPDDPVTERCPIHGEEWQLKPAGVSKRTGARYNAFWTCPVRDCPAKPWETAEAGLPF